MEKKQRGKLKFFLVMLVAVIFGTSFFTDLSIPELFEAIRNREPLINRAHIDLIKGVEEKKTEIIISKSRWDTDICAWSKTNDYVMDFVQANPHNFYVDIRNTKFSTREEGVESTIILQPAYFEELCNETARQKLEIAANEIIQTIPAGVSEWEKAKFLHDAVIRRVTYEEGKYDQTAYGALVEGKAVCMGYAMAYEYLMEKAGGIECDTVLGYGDSISAGMKDAMIPLPGHAWNLIHLEEGGVSASYYVDTTWDDIGRTDTQGQDYISYRWFCTTQEDMDKENRYLDTEVLDMSQWGNLNDNRLNYYIYTNAVMEQYSYDELVAILRRQIEEGNNFPGVRAVSAEVLFDIEYALGTQEVGQQLSRDLGIDGYAYTTHKDYLGDGLHCCNIYLNLE